MKPYNSLRVYTKKDIHKLYALEYWHILISKVRVNFNIVISVEPLQLRCCYIVMPKYTVQPHHMYVTDLPYEKIRLKTLVI